ncbi:MAG: hypothetical protein JSV44_08430 [Candidatus Zixiibacteriota bacterium]|nr:MAG: hypothetical protein JSV44_08430 [candidate division Zixibacteria bacterium]
MRKSTTTARFLILTAILTMLACSDSGTDNPPEPPPSASASIGAGGGTVEIPGNIVLDIPAGALSGMVDFVITRNDSPAPPDGVLGPVSPAYTVEPSGTSFSIPATVTIDYNQSRLGGGDESEITIYTHDGMDWLSLLTSVDTYENKASAMISDLSDFCAMVDTSHSLGGNIYAKLVVARNIYYYGSGDAVYNDMISASFDSSYAPCNPFWPIENVPVTCESYTLTWDANLKMHIYPEIADPQPPFIQLAGSYQFSITATPVVPALVVSIDFPSYAPYVTSPTYMSTIMRSSGMQVNWTNSDGGTVELILTTLSGDSAFMVEVNNNGSHFIESSHLTDLDPGQYSLVLNHYNRENISSAGYDPRGFMAGRIINSTYITLQ